MGEAIARFREMALTIRRVCDEQHSQPRGRAVKPAAVAKFVRECRLHFLDYEKDGMPYPARYVRGLCRLRDEAERHPDPPPPGEFDLPLYIEWLPEPFAKKAPGDSEIRKAAREAIKEAVGWGSLFETVEARIKALDAASGRMQDYAAPQCFELPVDKYWDSENGTVHTPTKAQADVDYIAQHRAFSEALDALAPFIAKPPTPAGSTSEKQTGGKQKKRCDRKGIGGQPAKYSMKFIREVVAARERDKKHAAKAKQPLSSFPRWLSDYCSGRGIDIGKMFPPKTPGEAWSKRANRFWKAAKARLSRAGN